jgi:hypothetical protein
MTAAPVDLELQDAAGETFLLRNRWREQPLVLVFLRHFG